MDKLQELEKRIENLEKKLNCSVNKSEEHMGFVEPSNLQENKFTYAGRFESKSGKVGSNFGARSNDIYAILNKDSFDLARVINAFSSEERVEIIKALLEQKLTAKELMEVLNFNTTGKLYHHLSFLEKLGAIKKSGETYEIVGKYIGAVILIFSGASKIIKNESETE